MSVFVGFIIEVYLFYLVGITAALSWYLTGIVGSIILYRKWGIVGLLGGLPPGVNPTGRIYAFIFGGIVAIGGPLHITLMLISSWTSKR